MTEIKNIYGLEELEISLTTFLYCSDIFRSGTKKLKKVFIDAKIIKPKTLAKLEEIMVEIKEYEGKDYSIEEFHPIVKKIFDRYYNSQENILKVSTTPEDSAYRMSVK